MAKLFPQCLQKACFPGASKGVIVWEWVKPPFHQQLVIYTCKSWSAEIQKTQNIFSVKKQGKNTN